jgi:hypothetical protein
LKVKNIYLLNLKISWQLKLNNVERKKPVDKISAEGWAVDGAIDYLTRALLTGAITKDEADRVAQQIMDSPIGIVAAKENREAFDRWIADQDRC